MGRPMPMGQMGGQMMPQVPQVRQEPEHERKYVPMTVNQVYNLNPLLAGQITSSEYFKQLLQDYPTFENIVDVLYEECTHLEPLEPGKARKPSVAFCCLYRFFLMKLDARQLSHLVQHRDSPYIRGVGFLFLRCVVDAKELATWVEPHLGDQTTFFPSSNREKKSTLGNYVHKLFQEIKYYDTTLRRVAIPVARQLERKSMELQIIRERAEALRPFFKINTICKARWAHDNKVYKGRIDDLLDNGNFLVTFVDFGNSDECEIVDLELDESQPQPEPEPEERSESRRGRSGSGSRSRSRSRSDSRGRKRRDKHKSKKRSRDRDRDRRSDRDRDRDRRSRDKDRDRRSDRKDRDRRSDRDRDRRSDRDRDRRDRKRGRSKSPDGKDRRRSRSRSGGRRTRDKRAPAPAPRRPPVPTMSLQDEIEMRLGKKRETDRSKAVCGDGVYARLPTGYKKALGETVETVDRPRFQQP